MLRLSSNCSLLETTDCPEKKAWWMSRWHPMALKNHFVVQLFQNGLLWVTHTDYVTFQCLII